MWLNCVATQIWKKKFAKNNPTLMRQYLARLIRPAKLNPSNFIY